jgi:hypothetical protein
VVSGVERFKIFSNGNFAINSLTDAGYKLDVNGTFISRGNAVLLNGLTSNASFSTAGISSDGRMALYGTDSNGTIQILAHRGAFSGGSAALFPGSVLAGGGLTGAIGLQGTQIAIQAHVVGIGVTNSGTHKSLAIGTPNTSVNSGFGGNADTIDIGTFSSVSNTWGGTRPSITYTALHHIFKVNNGTGQNNPGTTAVYISSSGNVGIGTSSPNYTLDVLGSSEFVGNMFLTGSLSITSSAGTGSAIYAYKSGSTVLDIQGSQGQLFSVTDALSGSLMSVNDVSGLPILEVFSDDRVVMGTYGAPALTVTGSTLIATGSLLGTASYATTALSASYAPSTPAFPYTGSAKITGSLDITGSLTVSGSSTFTNIGPAIFSGSITQTDSTASFGGLVGIGTTTPSAKLEVSGTIKVNTNQGYYTTLNDYELKSVGTNLYLNNSNGDPDVVIGDNNLFRVYTSANQIYVNGNVGIGTTSPSSKLHVLGTGTTSGTTALLVQNANASASLAVLDNGNVGIGTTSPTSILDTVVSNGAKSGIRFRGYSDASTPYLLSLGTYTYSDIFQITSVNGLVSLNNTSLYDLALGTNNTERLRITSTGNVGIGKTTPNAKLDVSGSAIITGSLTVTGGITGSITSASYATQALSASYALTASYALNAGDSVWTGSGGNIYYNGGNVGIGTTSPSDKLTIQSSGTGTGLKIIGYQPENFINLNNVLSTGDRTFRLIAGITSVGYEGFSIFDTVANDTRFVINNSGNIGIGTTTPTRKLQVTSGDILIDNDRGYFAKNTGGSELTLLQLDTSNNCLIGSPYQGATTVIYSTTNTLFYSYPSSVLTETMRITTTGNVGIGTPSPTSRLQVKGSGATSGTTALLVQNANASASLAVLDDGNVGIGTTNPIYNLEVVSSTGYAGIGIRSAQNNSAELSFQNAGYGLPRWTIRASAAADGSSGNLVFQRNASTFPMTITSGDNVLIGTTTDAGYKLDVNGSARIASSLVADTLGALSGATVGYLNLVGSVSIINKTQTLYIPLLTRNTTGSEVVYDFSNVGSITATGNVGIGKTTPNSKLDVSGSAIITGSLTVTGGITGSITSASFASTASYVNPLVQNVSVNGNFTVTGSTANRSTRVTDTGFYISRTSDGTYVSSIIADGNMTYGTRDSHIFQNDTITTMTLTGGTRNVLIGTSTDAGYKLDVNGTARFGDLSSTYYATLANGGADGGIFRVGGASYGYAELKSYALTLNGGHSIAGTGGTSMFALNSNVNPTAAQTNASIKFVADNSGSGGGTWAAYPTALAFNFLKKETNASYTSLLALNGNTNFVGIGTTIPSAKLHISGASSAALLEIDSPAVNNILYVSGSGNVGIGTGTPSRTLQVVGGDILIDNDKGFFSKNTGGSELSLLKFDPSNNCQIGSVFQGATTIIYSTTNTLFYSYPGSVVTENMRITTAGNVGIGTPSPTARLQVKGSGATSSTTALLVQNANTSASLAVLDNGYVGIGTSSPSNSLTIKTGVNDDGILLESSAGNPLFLVRKDGTSNNTAELFQYSSGAIRLAIRSIANFSYFNGGNFGFGTTTDVGYRLTISGSSTSGSLNVNNTLYVSGSSVGIGTTTPSYLLDVNGTARVTTLIETSAAKYKTNIQPLESQLSKVTQLEPVTFDWIDKPNPKTNIGLIADEVEKIYP